MTAADYPRRTAFKLIEELRQILAGQASLSPSRALANRAELGPSAPFPSRAAIPFASTSPEFARANNGRSARTS